MGSEGTWLRAALKTDHKVLAIISESQFIWTDLRTDR